MVRETTDTDSILEFAHAAASGLRDTPRWLPCRYLYDKRGSELFELICEQPEYYLTRTEASILAAHADDIRDATGPVTLIELGSGTSVKTDYLLGAYTAPGSAVRYIPVDISESALRAAAENITRGHVTVDVAGIVGTYASAFPLFREHSPCMVLFLGSTIGNLNRTESVEFWRRAEASLPCGDFFLLGVDLVKDVELIEAAYNDAAGVTAEFTKNVFARMNRELDAGIDLDQIEHVAVYNAELQRIEISARFLTEQEIHIGPLRETVTIGAGDMVMTEISRKFVLDDLEEYLADFGLDTRRVFTDEQRRFALLLLRRGEI